MKAIAKTFAAGLILAVSACSSFENFKRIGTYEYEGTQYDIYTADEVEHSDSQVNQSSYVLIPKGERPHHLNVVVSCDIGLGGPTAAGLKECERELGRQLKNKANPTAPRQEGDMY